MRALEVTTHDGIQLKYAISDPNREKQWIAFVIPFGLKLSTAKYFFDFFSNHYNIVAWESRSILESSNRKPQNNEYSLKNHVEDLRIVLTSCGITSCVLVGYCSGAGIALAAANRFPQLFQSLILEHGEYSLLSDKTCTTQFALEIDNLLSLAAKGEEYLESVFEKVRDSKFKGEQGRPKGIDLPFTNLDFLRRYSANYLAYKGNDFCKIACTVKHKVLLTTGKRDVQANVKSTEEIDKCLENSELRVDPETDHYGILRRDSSSMITIWNYLCEDKFNREKQSMHT